MEHNPKEVWKILSELKSTERSPQPHKYTLNATKWITHLENLLGQNTAVDVNRKEKITRELDKIKQTPTRTNLDNPITISEIMQAVTNLKTNKAPGKDGITSEIIKASIPSISSVVYKLFNAILQSGNYPTQWKDGINVPIFKNGDPNNPNNYRGITLNSSFGKLFCQVINRRIENYLEQNNLLIKEQAGFRKKSRTTDHIFILKKIIDNTITKRNGRLYSCFVDFHKAFDNIWHDALFLKLRNIGLNGHCSRIIEDMYTNSLICTRTSNGFTDSFPVKKGVLQGNILSPTLFNVFINDIKNTLHNNDSPFVNESANIQTPCLLYADDIVLLSTTKAGLQKQLDQLYTYCQLWGLNINRDKTKVIIFTKKDPKIPVHFLCGDDCIETVDAYKYLGVIFHKTGKFQYAEDHLAKQGNKAAHALKRSVRGKELKMDVMMYLFDTLVTPIISYGAEVWLPFNQPETNTRGSSTLSDQFSTCISSICPTENVHINFCRSLLGVHKRTMKVPVLAELGRYPNFLNNVGQVIMFWVHILESREDSYLRQAYDDMLLMDSCNKVPWIHFVKTMLFNIGFSHVWKNQGTLNMKRLRYAILNKLQEEYIQFWRNTKNGTSSRLSFYNTIVDNYELQPYLMKCKNFKHRAALCRLRLSAHDLEIEKGRHRNIAAKDRLCKSCGVPEDELHFLDKCSIYDELRSCLLISFYSLTNSQSSNPRSNNLDKKTIYQTPSSLLPLEHGQAELAKYVYECIIVRSRYMSSANLQA
jgi:hypothetical protein